MLAFVGSDEGGFGHVSQGDLLLLAAVFSARWQLLACAMRRHRADNGFTTTDPGGYVTFSGAIRVIPTEWLKIELFLKKLDSTSCAGYVILTPEG